MKNLLLKYSLFGAFVLWSSTLIAQYSPYGVKMFEHNFHIQRINNYELYASGFSIFTMNVVRNTNGTITDMDATWNTLFGNKKNLTTSAFNGNRSFYNNQIIDANNGINSFATDTREIFESDGSNDTTITEVEYDAATNALIKINKYAFTYNGNGNIQTIHEYFRIDSSSSFSLHQIDNYYYNSSNMIDSIITTNGNTTKERTIYYTTGTKIDSIYFYSNELGGGIKLMQIGRFSYTNASTIVNLYSDDDQDGKFTFEARWTFNIGTTGLAESKMNNFTIYPNPCVDQLKIISAKAQTFEIHTIDGKLKTGGVLNEGTNHVNLSAYPAGIYFIKTESRVEKIIVAH
ncbi:MAG: T9SS type A sorting domain-containing protein [Bacteroidetes bacterium]|nr:T9SS type A sorting domain-containing protein [Bacteroidota bacterium]